ncbi:DUF883 domain-containing protein [Paraglaciecola sp. 2405UD69-4]|uniref:DUF883 domain-containing protein n=1 Tax=Paraglaciecola sp. 2405UD69-4 TaxID=3391836 RepID=UPI0039C94CC1
MATTANSGSQTTKAKASKTATTPIAEKVTETLHESVDTLADHGASLEQKLRESASDTAANVSEKQAQAKEYWDGSAVGKYTKENPLATAGIAFAAGVLLTSLLKRK